MSQNGESPPPGTPARVRRREIAGADAPGTPAAAGSPRGSPGSAASASPAFARTPRSGGGSPAPAPSPAPATPGPRRAGSASVVASPAADLPGSPESAGAVRTPAARPGVSSSPVPSASPPWARTPGSGRRDTAGSPVPSRRSDPAASPASSRRGPRVAPHRGFLGTTPAREPGRGGAPDFDENAADLDLEEGTYLYGTDIKETKVVVEVHKFIRNCHVPETQGERSHYLQQLDKMWDEASSSAQRQKGIKFPILGTHIHGFSPTLYGNLVNFPTEVIPIFDRELWNISVRELAADPESIGVCQVQIHSLMERDSKIMRNMNPSDIEKLITIKGIVIRCSDLVPDMMSAVFRCTVEDCKHEEAVALSHWTIEEPTRCESCGGNRTFQIVHNECTFMDKQVLKLQETPELVPEGETPQNVAVTCHEDLVDQVRPGDRVEVTGIFRASAVKPMANFKQHNAVYRTYVDAISIYTETKGRIDQPQEDLDTLLKQEMPKLSDKKDLDPETNTEEEIRWNLKVRELAQAKDESGVKTVVSRLVQSFAPSIFEEDEVKKGLLCQLFGGTPKPLNSTTKGKCRPEINTLLCGDPSTAKSQLMQYAYKLAPRGVYTSGKGSSAVGLTASINKDPATGELVLESGALVLADRGVCCIDEFDKMDENARAILHEAMEQQTVSVAKSGIVCSLNARSSILASANPKDSAYDPKMSIVENINLPKNLMTRFDFIWLMLDKRQKDTDKRLAEHLISMYSVSGARRRVDPSIDSETFRRYVSFAKRWVFPRLTDEAEASLVKGYIDLRNQGSSREAITATPRILECLIRTSESLAKMELREEVSTADVEESIRLLKAATYAAAVDPETGLIDMEQLIVGMGAARRKRNRELEQLVQDIVAEQPDQQLNQEQVKATMNERLGERKEQLASEKEFSDALRAVEQAGLIRRQGKMLEARAS